MDENRDRFKLRFDLGCHPNAAAHDELKLSSQPQQQQLETTPKVTIRPRVWHEHHKTTWRAGETTRFETADAIGAGCLLVKSHKGQKEFLAYEELGKETIIRLCIKFKSDITSGDSEGIDVRRLLIGGIYTLPLRLNIPDKLASVLGGLAEKTSPQISFYPKTTDSKFAHALTPLFCLLDGLRVVTLRGETLEEMKEIDLTLPVYDDWMEECGVLNLLPKEEQKKSRGLGRAKAERDFRKALNKPQIKDWPANIRIRPDQYIVGEITDKAMRMLLWEIHVAVLAFSYTRFADYVPFAIFLLPTHIHFQTTSVRNPKTRILTKCTSLYCIKHKKHYEKLRDCCDCILPKLWHSKPTPTTSQPIFLSMQVRPDNFERVKPQPNRILDYFMR